MSSVASAPDEAPSGSRPTARAGASRQRSLSPDWLVGALVAAALTLISFTASGGTDLRTNTWVQVAVVVLGAVAAIAVALRGARGPAWGATALLLFAALAALTYASIAWSVQPALSWLEANRTLSYLAAFGVALLAGRVAPERWRGLLGGIAVATSVVSGYALLVKVFPATFDPLDTLGRLSLPFGYWNAVGLMAALGIPACLWAGARRDLAPPVRALSMPAIAGLIAALVLSYSRGAIAAAVIGAALWFAVVPLRLRGALVLSIGGAGAAAITGWALADRGITSDNIALSMRTGAGHEFGVVLLVVLALTTLAALAAAYAMDRAAPGPAVRRRVGTALVGVAALIPVLGVVALAASSRGLTGEVSHIWSTLTNPNGVVGDKPGRLVDLSNSRPHYWSEALKVGEHHLLAGTGALGFASAQAQYTSGVWDLQHSHANHAHGFLFQTFSDFGLIGVVLSLALLVAWAVAAARPLGVRWPGRGARVSRPPPAGDATSEGSASDGSADPAARGAADEVCASHGSAGPTARGAVELIGHADAAERIGMLTMLTIVVTFGLHSLIDWTWFIPATAVVGLACAGWLAGRGPLEVPVGRTARRRELLRSPSIAIAIASVLAIGLAAVWVTVQPLRSADATSAALAAAIRGDAATALTDARTAAAEDPVSVEPLGVLAKVYVGLGDQRAARRELADAISRQPSNPAVWDALGCYDLGQHNVAASTSELHRAVVLAPGNTALEADPAGFCGALSGDLLGGG